MSTGRPQRARSKGFMKKDFVDGEDLESSPQRIGRKKRKLNESKENDPDEADASPSASPGNLADSQSSEDDDNWSPASKGKTSKRRSTARPNFKKIANEDSLGSLLRDGKASNSGSSFRCEQCDRKFPTAKGLVRHVATHEEERRFVCHTCGKGFNQSSTLSRHRAIHSTDTPFECKVCGKAFNRCSTLNAHMLTHNEEKRFKCPICKKGFHQKGNLKNHIFTHTGERPYVCKICNAGFNQHTNLTNHMGTQHGIFNNICRECNEEFDNREQLVDHIESAHGKSFRLGEHRRKSQKRQGPTKCELTAPKSATKRSHGVDSIKNEPTDKPDVKPALDRQATLVLHRGVLKLCSLSTEEKEALDEVELKLPPQQRALRVPARISGIEVPNREMMYRVILRQRPPETKMEMSKEEEEAMTPSPPQTLQPVEIFVKTERENDDCLPLLGASPIVEANSEHDGSFKLQRDGNRNTSL